MPELWADSLGEHRELVRERIYAAFAELVAEGTIDAVTLSAVAGRAGIARSAIYNYVEDKHDLVLSYTEHVVGCWLARRAGEEAGPSHSPAARLEGFVRDTFTVFASDPVAGRDMGHLLNAAEMERLLAALAPLRVALYELVQEGVDAEAFRGPAGEVTQYVWAVCAGYRTMLAAAPEAAGAMAVAASRLLLDGIAARHEAERPPDTPG